MVDLADRATVEHPPTVHVVGVEGSGPAAGPSTPSPSGRRSPPSGQAGVDDHRCVDRPAGPGRRALTDVGGDQHPSPGISPATATAAPAAPRPALHGASPVIGRRSRTRTDHDPPRPGQFRHRARRAGPQPIAAVGRSAVRVATRRSRPRTNPPGCPALLPARSQRSSTRPPARPVRTVADPPRRREVGGDGDCPPGRRSRRGARCCARRRHRDRLRVTRAVGGERVAPGRRQESTIPAVASNFRTARTLISAAGLDEDQHHYRHAQRD